jgi:hypothetical protein
MHALPDFIFTESEDPLSDEWESVEIQRVNAGCIHADSRRRQWRQMDLEESTVYVSGHA